MYLYFFLLSWALKTKLNNCVTFLQNFFCSLKSLNSFCLLFSVYPLFCFTHRSVICTLYGLQCIFDSFPSLQDTISMSFYYFPKFYDWFKYLKHSFTWPFFIHSEQMLPVEVWSSFSYQFHHLFFWYSFSLPRS